GSPSVPIEVNKGSWYRLKVAAVGDRVVAKLWREDTDQPRWQLDVEVSQRDSGSFALVGHDDTQVEFDWVRASSQDDSVATLRAEAEKKRQALLAKLQLATAVE